MAEYGASRAVAEPRNDALLSAVRLNVVAPHKLVNTQRGAMTFDITTFSITKIISDTQQSYTQHYGMECHLC